MHGIKLNWYYFFLFDALEVQTQVHSLRIFLKTRRETICFLSINNNNRLRVKSLLKRGNVLIQIKI